MKTFRMILSLCLVALLLTASTATAADQPTIHFAALKGPTGMGAAHLIAQSDAGNTAQAYDITLAGAPDAITGKLITGELDIAALPTNTIAMLYNRTGGAVQSLAVNTLGVLYLLQRGDAVQSTADLADSTIVAAGQGTTVEAVISRLFGEDVAVDYVSEHAEAVALAVAGQYDLVLLPEPFVTSLLSQDEAFSTALDLTAEWKAQTGTLLPMGGIAVRTQFAQENPEAVEAFLAEYAQSVAYANENPAEASILIEQYDIMNAAVAAQAIPRANMVCITGTNMRAALEAFYATLLESEPALLGGAMPGDDFFYAP